jgi:hypothetical protein
MYVTRSLEINVCTRQVVELPAESEILGLRRMSTIGPGIFLDFVFDQPEDGRPLTEKRIIYVAQVGTEMPEYKSSLFDPIGYVDFDGNLRFYVWGCGVEE